MKGNPVGWFEIYVLSAVALGWNTLAVAGLARWLFDRPHHGDPIGSLLFVGTYVFGGLVLRDFALALFVRLLTRAYSSIFVATPLLAWLKEREPRYRALRERAQVDLARRQERADDAVPVAATPSATSAAVPGGGVAVEGAPEDAPAEAPAEAPLLAASTPEPEPAPAPPSSTSATGTRGAANPRGRQQRGKKRR